TVRPTATARQVQSLLPGRAVVAYRHVGPSIWSATSPSGWRTGCRARRRAQTGAALAMTPCASLGRVRPEPVPVRCRAAAAFAHPPSAARLPAHSLSTAASHRPARPSSSAFVAPASICPIDDLRPRHGAADLLEIGVSDDPHVVDRAAVTAASSSDWPVITKSTMAAFSRALAMAALGSADNRWE